MSLAFITHFDHVVLHVLAVRGRPALLAHEVGVAAGYRDSGQAFVRSIRTEWNESLNEDDDLAELSGAELNAIKREVTTLAEANNVLVLFPSGVEKALGRTHVRGAQALLGFLNARVYSQVVSLGRAGVGAPIPPAASPEAPRWSRRRGSSGGRRCTPATPSTWRSASTRRWSSSTRRTSAST